MGLRLPTPMRRSDSTFPYFRRRIPRDILDAVRGRTIRVPVGEVIVEKMVSAKANEIVLSLQTRDPAEAKAREIAILAHLDKTWEALRTGPDRLTRRHAVALAGEVYFSLLEQFGDDPGPSEVWETLAVLNDRAMDGRMVLSGRKTAANGLPLLQYRDVAASVERWFGPVVDDVLARHSLVIDDDSRSMLMRDVAAAHAQATRQLARQAEGDFTPDPQASRFPEMPKQGPAPQKPQFIPFDQLIDGRWKEAQAAGGSRRTLSAWRTAFGQFAAFLGHDDAARVTRADVVAFKDHRLAEGASVKTVKDSDLAALKSVFGWAADNGHLPANPAEGVTVKIGRAARRDIGRERGFTDAEAQTILRHALDYTPASPREKPKTAAAQRWVPWLLALSGARVGEAAQLRKEDVFEKAGRWVMRITADAGTVKTGETRLVPLHPQIVELGFIDFVNAAEPGHLFVTPPDPSDPEGAVKGLTNRLRVGLRGIVPDDVSQPFHAWRHRFKTKARDLGCDEGVTRAILGHAARDVSDRYGDTTVTAAARVIDSLPPFPLSGAR